MLVLSERLVDSSVCEDEDEALSASVTFATIVELADPTTKLEVEASELGAAVKGSELKIELDASELVAEIERSELVMVELDGLSDKGLVIMGIVLLRVSVEVEAVMLELELGKKLEVDEESKDEGIVSAANEMVLIVAELEAEGNSVEYTLEEEISSEVDSESDEIIESNFVVVALAAPVSATVKAELIVLGRSEVWLSNEDGSNDVEPEVIDVIKLEPVIVAFSNPRLVVDVESGSWLLEIVELVDVVMEGVEVTGITTVPTKPAPEGASV